MELWPWLAGAVALVVLQAWMIRRLRRRLRQVDHAKRSQATRHGKTMEHFAPFLAHWPWDPRRFRFLGDPIDGVQFTDEGIVLVEIKAGGRLSAVQRQVRDHVRAGRVTWHEFRMNDSETSTKH